MVMAIFIEISLKFNFSADYGLEDSQIQAEEYVIASPGHTRKLCLLLNSPMQNSGKLPNPENAISVGADAEISSATKSTKKKFCNF
jgi:hypothetical protein